MASDVYITPSPPPAPSTGLWGGCPSPSSLAHRIFVHHTHQMHHRAQLQKPPPFDVDIVPVEPSTAALHAPHVRRSFLTCVQKTLSSFAIGRPPFTSLWTKLVEFFGDGAPDVPLCKHHLEGCSLNFGYVGFGDGWGRLKHFDLTPSCHPSSVNTSDVEPSTAALHAPHVRRSFLTCVQKTLSSFAIGRPPFTSLWTKLVEFFGDGAPDVPLCKHHLEGCSLNFGYVGFGDGWGRLKHLQSTFLCHAIPNFGSVGWGDCWMSLFLSRHLSNILLVWGDFGAYFGFPSLPKGYAFVGDLYI